MGQHAAAPTSPSQLPADGNDAEAKSTLQAGRRRPAGRTEEQQSRSADHRAPDGERWRPAIRSTNHAAAERRRPPNLRQAYNENKHDDDYGHVRHEFMGWLNTGVASNMYSM